jgi:hypothetical protein
MFGRSCTRMRTVSHQERIQVWAQTDGYRLSGERLVGRKLPCTTKTNSDHPQLCIDHACAFTRLCSGCYQKSSWEQDNTKLYFGGCIWGHGSKQRTGHLAEHPNTTSTWEQTASSTLSHSLAPWPHSHSHPTSASVIRKSPSLTSFP